MALYQPTGEAGRASTRLGPLLLGLSAALVLALGGLWHPAFVTPSLPLSVQAATQASLRRARALPQALRAARGDQAVDAEMVGEDAAEEAAVEDEEIAPAVPEGAKFPVAAYVQYGAEETPDDSWFARRKIDRHKVNNVFFDMYRKPTKFFPHKLQAGDTVRVFYLEPTPTGDKEQRDYKSFGTKALKQIYFDGVILNFRGEYHGRTMTMRAMVGKGENTMGYELQFPMHSPLITRIDVLRRGYIGRNKNAYFMRGMIGKRNVIPLDKERTEMDEMYAALREEGRDDEIPESEYPQQEWDRYPLPTWKQDADDWDEEKYAPQDVDQRSEYERRVIAKYKLRISPTGRYGWHGRGKNAPR